MMRTTLTTLLLLTFFASPALAGAWLQPEGKAYLRLSSGILNTETRFDSEGEEVPFDASGGGFRNVSYEDLAVNFYAEVGIHPDWTLIGVGSWKNLQAEQPSAIFTTYGFGDLGLGVKRSLYRSTWTVASASGMISVPTGYDPAEYPAIGSDVSEGSVSLELGRAGHAWWSNVESFLKIRGGDFRSQVGGSLGGGFSVSSSWAFRGEFRGAVPVGSTDNTGSGALFDPTAVDPSNLDVAGTVSFNLPQGVAIEAGLRSTVWGENTLKGTRFSVALATSPSLRLWGGEE